MEKEREIALSRQPFVPKQIFFSPRSAVLEAFDKKECGRYRLPVVAAELFRFRARAFMEKNDPFKEETFVFLPSTVPLPWHYMVEYLFQEGVLSAPYFIFPETANDKPKLARAYLSFAFDVKKTDGFDVSTSGSGATAKNFEEAFSKAVGEALERYMLTIYKDKDFLCALPRELEYGRRLAFPVGKYNRFFDWQRAAFPFLGAETSSRIVWVEGEELLGGGKALLPAQLVFWNYRRAEGEPVLANSNTSGGAGHFSHEEAVLSSLYENIERDAFMVHWLTGSAPAEIDVARASSELLRGALENLPRYVLEARFFDTTLDTGVPSAVCVLRDISAGGPKITVASAAGYDAEQVLLRSLQEAISVSGILDSGKAFSLPPEYKPFLSSGIGRAERLLLWQGKAMDEQFSFFIKGEKKPLESFISRSKSFSSKKNELDHLLSVFRALGPGYEVFCYRARHSVLDALGYHVVKTIVPRFFPMYLSEHMATLDSDRLATMRSRTGGAADITPWPHPFP